MAVRSLAEVPIYSDLTYDSYLKLPFMNQRYDIIDGDLFMSPAPTGDHQWVLSEVNDRIKPFVVAHKLGVVLFAPLDVIIRRLPRMRTRQPDLVFYAAETIGGADKASVRAARERDVSPDLAVEILSTSEHRRAVEAKLRDYAAIGVKEVWQVDPHAQTIAVLRLGDGDYHEVARFGESDEFVSELLPGFSLSVVEVFE